MSWAAMAVADRTVLYCNAISPIDEWNERLSWKVVMKSCNEIVQ